MSQDRIDHLLTIVLAAITAASAKISYLDYVEQIGRICLIGVSITSGVFLILVNWNKAKEQLKDWLK